MCTVNPKIIQEVIANKLTNELKLYLKITQSRQKKRETVLIITCHLNGLSTPIKRYRL